MKKPKPTQKSFLITALIATLIAIGAIAYAQTGQGHPLGEIDFSQGTANANLDMSNNAIKDVDWPNSDYPNNECSDYGDGTDFFLNSYGNCERANSCLDCASRFLDVAGDTMSGDLDMNNNLVKDVNVMRLEDTHSDGYTWGISENSMGKLQFERSGTPDHCTISESNKMTCDGGLDAGGSGITNPGKLFRNMDCVNVHEANDGNTNVETASCPNGYYVVWPSVNAGSSIKQSVCNTFVTDGFCTEWKVYTGGSDNLIIIDLLCCK